MHTRFLTTPARAALIAAALASTGAMAQTADIGAAPPPTATLPDASPPPVVRTVNETVAPEALAQVRAEQAAKAKPAAKPVTRVEAAPARSTAAAAPVTTASEPVDTPPAEAVTTLPITAEPAPVADPTPLPPPEATASADSGTSNDDLMLYGGVAILAVAGIGAAMAARRRKGRFTEDDRGAVVTAANTAAAPQPRPMAPTIAEPGRTRIIEPAAAPAAPVVAPAAAVAAATPARTAAKPISDPLFAKQAPLPEGVTDPLFARRNEPLPPVTDPLFQHQAELAPVTDPMFADRPDYAGPGSKGSRAEAINRMRATGQTNVKAKDVEFVH